MRKIEHHIRRYYTVVVSLFLFSCSVQQSISKRANKTLINTPELSTAHVGIAIFDPVRNTFLYNYQGDHYFIPASNTKLFSLFAGLKYTPDSIVAARVAIEDGTVTLLATGDPTFLHPDFKTQPLMQFLQNPAIQKVQINTPFGSTPFGKGWAWDDYPYAYMAERDPFPIYGNVATVVFEGDTIRTVPPAIKPFVIGKPDAGKPWSLRRDLAAHFYTIDTSRGTLAPVKTITMSMDRGLFASRFLSDTLHKEVVSHHAPFDLSSSIPIYSQPKDSLFKVMMHRSDNFFAEQTLLMAANEHLGEMNDAKMIDTLLSTDLKEMPQKPKWVDGSGLSRYNLASPRDFVWLLKKLQDEWGLKRLMVLLPTANEGTLEGLYKGYEGKIFAKTGTLSNNLALSGFLITQKNRQLIFSVMVNNHQASSTQVRKEIEGLLTSIIQKY